MSKTSILLLPSLIGKHDFGGATHQSELINSLSQRLNVYMIHQRKPISLKTAVCLPQVTKQEFRWFNSLSYLLRSTFLGLNIIKKKKIKLIYVRHGIATLPGIIIGKLSNLPVILEVNGIISEEITLQNHNKRLVVWLLHKIERIGTNYSSRIITVTDGLKEYFIKTYGKDSRNIIVIPNGANTNTFTPKNTLECRRALKLKPQYHYIVFVGSLMPWQGVEYLVKAMPIVVKEVNDVQLLVIGSGPKEEELRKLAVANDVSGAIKFIGAVPYEKIPGYINAGDVCAAPFIRARNQEIGVSPLKIYEYAACGKPVISSKIKDLDFISREGMGLLVEPENLEALGDALISVLGDPDLAASMGNKGREVVKEKYGWDKAADKVADLCARMLNA